MYRQSLSHGFAVPPPFTQGRLNWINNNSPKNFFKKPVDFIALLCYTVSHSFKKTMKTEYILFLALPKTMVEARKLSVTQDILRAGFPVLQERNFRRSFRKNAVFRLLGQRKISFGLSLRWRAIIGFKQAWFLPVKHFCKNVP